MTVRRGSSGFFSTKAVTKGHRTGETWTATGERRILGAMSQENVEIVRRGYEAFNRGDIEA